MSAPRSRSAVAAAVLAMVASGLSLGAVVLSDIAEAGSSREVFADDAPPVVEVIQRKLVVKPDGLGDTAAIAKRVEERLQPIVEEPMENAAKPTKKRKRVSFGTFEGY